MSYTEVTTVSYNLRLILELFFFYIIFYYLYREISLQKKIIYPVFILPPTIMLQIYFEGFGEILPIISLFFLLTQKSKNNYPLLNALLISSIVPYVASIAISTIVINNPVFIDFSDLQYIMLELSLELFVVTIFLYILKITDFRIILYQYSSLLSALLLFFYYFSLQIFLYIAIYFEAYEKFILGIELFLIVQIVFLAIVFVKETRRKKQSYINLMLKKQLEDFKTYSITLEENQKELRKFKHDYKNLILSLKELGFESNPETFEKRIDALEEYSESYLNLINWQYNDLENLRNIYIKSLFISKMYTIQRKNIDFSFECKYPVEHISIEVFDLVRILGISLDNAIEATIDAKKPMIHVAIIQDENQLEFIIKNTAQEISEGISKLLSLGFTTKEGHLGLGLSNLQEIKKKYPNLYVQYEKSMEQFMVQIILTYEGAE